MQKTLNVLADNNHLFHVDFCGDDDSIEKIERLLV